MRRIILLLTITIFTINIFGQNLSSTGQTSITITNQFPDYEATPGDVYTINFLVSGGNKETQLVGFVDNNYDIDLSFLGTINVKEYRYTEVQSVLKETITSAYPGSIVNVTIQIPGKFKVTLLGEVVAAQIIEAMSITTLAEILVDKTTDFASYRDIEVRSEDGSINVYDLFKFKRYADLKNNPFLRPNDVITIRPYSRVVQVNGEVKRPGPYQLVEGDTLDTLINLYADGFTKLAERQEITIKRVLTDETIYINGLTQDLSTIQLLDYDVVEILNHVKFNPKVLVQGAISTDTSAIGSTVSNKVPVIITTDSKVSTVLDQMEASFNLTSDLKNAFILRDNEKIFINIEDIMSNLSSEYNVVLHDKDMIIIPFRQLQVYVAGSVNKSGAVPFIEDRTAEYYIGLAGGFNQEENLFGTYKILDVEGNRVSKNKIIEPEDLIWANKDHPMAYVDEYGGWILTISSIFIAAYNINQVLEGKY